MVAFAFTRWPGVMPWNFSAAYALAFCAGLYFPTVLAWMLPLATLLVTDLLLNAFYYRFPWAGFPAGILPNYIGYAAFIGLGILFRSKRAFWKLMCGSLLGAVVFYVISNTAAWLTLPQYSKTFFGWVQALTTGLPGYPPTWMFFWKTLLSSGLFSGLFIGSMKAVESMEEAKETEEEKEEEPASDEAEEPAAS